MKWLQNETECSIFDFGKFVSLNCKAIREIPWQALYEFIVSPAYVPKEKRLMFNVFQSFITQYHKDGTVNRNERLFPVIGRKRFK